MELQSEHSGAQMELLRAWKHVRKFSLNFAAVNSDVYRETLKTWLDEQCTGQVQSVTIEHSAADDIGDLPVLAAQAFAELKNTEQLLPRLHIQFEGYWQPSAKWWGHLNGMRERLADAFPHVIVIWCNDESITLAARNAVDLWNWRDAVLDFSLAGKPVEVDLSTPRIDFVSVKEKEKMLARLVDIEEYLNTHEQSTASGLLMLEAAYANFRLGNWSESLRLAKLTVTLFEQLGNETLLAQSKEQIAIIYMAHGQFEESLELLSKQILPIHDQLRNIRQIAVVKGYMADIFKLRGQLDEALKLLTNEVIPTFEKIGDIRELAVTKGQIADIFTAFGRIDEALEIRKKHQLPVYEQLGDVREAAATKGQIADIYKGRGRFDLALEILEKQMLPTYEQLGETREIAVTKARIGQILVARGNWTDALKILRYEVKPIFEQMALKRELEVVNKEIREAETRLKFSNSQNLLGNLMARSQKK